MADFHPTKDPLLGWVKKAIIQSRTTRPVEHSSTFDTSKLHDLFISWGDEPSLKQTRTKLLAMLCVLGTLQVASTALLCMNQVLVITLDDRHCALSMPIVGYKNDTHSDGKTILLHQSSMEKSGIMARIQAGINPDVIFCLGRWQSAEMFYKHYVVQNVPCTYTNVIFDIDESDTIPNESTL